MPVTAHSPGSAAVSNTKVSDGSSRMVRKSFMIRAQTEAVQGQIRLAVADIARTYASDGGLDMPVAFLVASAGRR